MGGKENEFERGSYQELIGFSLDQGSLEIYWITPEGRFVYANDTVRKKLGYSKDELTDMHVWDIDPNHGEDIRKERWEKLKKEKVLNFETEHKTKDGETYPVEIISHYIEHNGDEYEFAFVRDITKRRKAEEREEALYFLLTQDLKNKVQTVGEYLEKMKELDLSEDAESYLEKAIEKTNDEKELIEKVEDLPEMDEWNIEKDKIGTIINRIINEDEKE